MLRRTNARAQSAVSFGDNNNNDAPSPQPAFPKRKRKHNKNKTSSLQEGEDSCFVLVATAFLGTLIVFFLGAYVYILSGVYVTKGQPTGAWKENVLRRSDNLARGADILVEHAEQDVKLAEEKVQRAEYFLGHQKDSLFKKADTLVKRAENSFVKRKNSVVQRLRRRKGAAASTSNQYPPAFPVLSRDKAVASRLSQDALDMCTRTLWHTLETTTIVLPRGDTFIHTGDIDDLWLRDSAAQIHTLLIPVFNGTALIQHDQRLDRIVSGLIKRTAMYIRHDPYANAFRIDDSYQFSAKQRAMGRHDLISTWNYELDSACYYMRLLYFYWKQSPSPDVLQLDSVQEAVDIMVDLWIAEQKHEDDQYPTGPLFDCKNCNKPYRYPGLARDGKGTPTNSSSGLIWTGFRPSDDECKYGFLIPANMFAVVALGYVAEMAEDLWSNPKLAQKAKKLAEEVEQGLQYHATVEHPTHGTIFAYEVDGLGNSNLMDDANIPSLMSLPYLGYNEYPEVYANTRKFILSPDNPTYHKGYTKFTEHEVEGYGSPHMNQAIRNNVWPMSIAMMGLTTDDVKEKLRLVNMLVQTTGETGWMHESFDVTNPRKFTRSWFCWSDSLFAELVLSLTDACPAPDHLYKVLEWRDPVKVPGGPFAAEP